MDPPADGALPRLSPNFTEPKPPSQTNRRSQSHRRISFSCIPKSAKHKPPSQTNRRAHPAPSETSKPFPRFPPRKIIPQNHHNNARSPFPGSGRCFSLKRPRNPNSLRPIQRSRRSNDRSFLNQCKKPGPFLPGRVSGECHTYFRKATQDFCPLNLWGQKSVYNARQLVSAATRRPPAIRR